MPPPRHSVATRLTDCPLRPPPKDRPSQCKRQHHICMPVKLASPVLCVLNTRRVLTSAFAHILKLPGYRANVRLTANPAQARHALAYRRGAPMPNETFPHL